MHSDIKERASRHSGALFDGTTGCSLAGFERNNTAVEYTLLTQTSKQYYVLTLALKIARKVLPSKPGDANLPLVVDHAISKAKFLNACLI